MLRAAVSLLHSWDGSWPLVLNHTFCCRALQRKPSGLHAGAFRMSGRKEESTGLGKEKAKQKGTRWRVWERLKMCWQAGWKQADWMEGWWKSWREYSQGSQETLSVPELRGRRGMRMVEMAGGQKVVWGSIRVRTEMLLVSDVCDSLSHTLPANHYLAKIWWTIKPHGKWSSYPRTEEHQQKETAWNLQLKWCSYDVCDD